MLIVPVRPPLALGANVAEIVQDALEARVLGQVFVCWKSPAFAPATPMLAIARGPLPLFVSVVACAALVVPTACWPKAMLDGVSVTAPAAPAPVPVSGTLCGLVAALSLIVTPAVRLPPAAGEKVTEIVQVAFRASVDGLSGHVVVRAKSAAFVPVIAMLVIVNTVVPEFVSVVDLAALVVPTPWEAKARLVGLNVTAGLIPVPLSATLCGLPAALSVTVRVAGRLPVAVGLNVTEMVQVEPGASVAGPIGHAFVCA